MRFFKSILIISCIALLAAGCSGDDGATGPAGPSGNANVMMLDFPGSTSSGGLMAFVYEVERSVIEGAMVLIYYNPDTEAETAWYQAPGLGSGGSYMTRTWWFQIGTAPSTYRFSIRFLTPDGAGTYGTDVTSRRTRIFIIPASTIEAQSSVSNSLDYSDYEAVKAHYGFSD
jgi:hypothetical protein